MDVTDSGIDTNIDNIDSGSQSQRTETATDQQSAEQREENESVLIRRNDDINIGEASADNELRLRRRRETNSTEIAGDEALATARREDKGKQVASKATAGGSSSTEATSTANDDGTTKTDPQQPSSSANDEFSCNICFDTAIDPVLTICGHLFCWSCLAQWLERSATCPVCKAGCDKEKVIPVYGRGKDKKDPRLNPNIPSRPAGQRPPAPQRQQNQFFGFDPFGVPGSFHGIGGGISMGRMGGSTHTYIGGFGILPALMGFSSFPINAAGNSNNAGGSGAVGAGQQAGQQAFASRVLMMLAAMILMSIVFS
ncbi:hypothetical protein IW140_003182 [Coemansia sp. RSA 1813]|nr:hypothetical protein EV178_003136 [Coemansia sp. RSA 1646]KAJ1773941.1 hypothetical protein LPJ74_000038 [Coemansia sp. RSA 1843]KAJ2089340.1 hypothetical protein IW138_003508 [Coemansia sp. RSA 986]KAJ2214442.1 hypothetical protein EV179_002985 [Coemansia sp. RSA 487]KAJ2569337.1 hypothetical protein IW140_003182 [Coemansia sp. RSA 1813]